MHRIHGCAGVLVRRRCCTTASLTLRSASSRIKVCGSLEIYGALSTALRLEAKPQTGPRILIALAAEYTTGSPLADTGISVGVGVDELEHPRLLELLRPT